MRAAVFGAGYAGLTVARRLERQATDLDIVVVDESDRHLVQHELHRLVRRPGLVDTITVELTDVLRDSTTIRQARVTDIDAEAGVATLDADGTEETLAYDVGAVCLGAETAFHDLPGVEDHAIPLKRVADAEAIRRGALTNPEGTVVVGGGGLSGIQVAGELAALSEERDLDLDVTIIERNDSVASGFGPTFRNAISRELDARDVTVETDASVTEADDEAVHLDDDSAIEYDTLVWTGGIRGPDAFEGNRQSVDSDMQVSPSTFVIGDAGSVVDEGGDVAPASAQTAVRQASVAVENILQVVEEGSVTDPRTYDYDPAGWVVSVGDGAVAQVGPVVLSGEPARAAKAVIGVGHLGSLGFVGNAADLVAEEFGWPTHASVVDLAELPGASVPTDPASMSDLQSTLTETGFALAEAFTPGDAVDLTFVTQLGDRTFPGSPTNFLERTLDPLSLLGGRSKD